MEIASEKLRDLSRPIDVPLLDATVAAFYGTGSKEEVMNHTFSFVLTIFWSELVLCALALACMRVALCLRTRKSCCFAHVLQFFCLYIVELFIFAYELFTIRD